MTSQPADERNGSAVARLNAERVRRLSGLRVPAYIGAALSFLSVLALPYGYYEFLRWALPANAMVLALIGVAVPVRAWVYLELTVITILWNPVLPVGMERSHWFLLNLLTGAAFAFLPNRRNARQVESTNT